MSESDAGPEGQKPPNEHEQRALDDLRAALGNDFDIVRQLGRGSVATVYLAKEKALDRLVAIKVLLPGQARDETARRRFEREARSAASLVHPHVVQVYRFGRLPDETPYLVMRFVKGRTMEERLMAEGRMSASVAQQVLQQVTSALAAAHSQGIVHRDVRPANILWDEDSGTAHLSDFGIAALVSASGDEATRLTKTGQLVGDPRYLSPEQLLDQELTPLADMYTVGILGYELLTGDGPYEAKTNTQWITSHLSAEPKDLRQLRPDIDPTVADLLRRCLNREPKHRPSAADAARILSGETGAALTAHGSGSVEEAADLEQLIRRRVPQIVVVAGAFAIGFIQLIGTLVDRGTLGQVWWELSLPFAACGVAASTIVAWFHGERGKQDSSVLEWIMLSVITVTWISVSAWILVGG